MVLAVSVVKCNGKPCSKPTPICSRRFSPGEHNFPQKAPCARSFRTPGRRRDRLLPARTRKRAIRCALRFGFEPGTVRGTAPYPNLRSHYRRVPQPELQGFAGIATSSSDSAGNPTYLFDFRHRNRIHRGAGRARSFRVRGTRTRRTVADGGSPSVERKETARRAARGRKGLAAFAISLPRAGGQSRLRNMPVRSGREASGRQPGALDDAWV